MGWYVIKLNQPTIQPKTGFALNNIQRLINHKTPTNNPTTELLGRKNTKKNFLENPGIDPGTSHMLSERSTIWANSPIATW